MRANNNGYRDINKRALDKLKWLIVFVLLVVIVWGNLYFSEPNPIYNASFMLRMTSIFTLSAFALLLIFNTQKGKRFLIFAKEARFELRKVVWPTRREALQTTLLIGAITIIASLFLWGLDSIIIRLVSFLTSLGHKV